jgi:tRNA pseudouridine38-40 synthase
MRNIFLKISFDGRNYHGFQIQPNAITVQEVLEKTLSKITGEDISVIGCSRTDSGVHANEFCLNFKTENPIPIEGLIRALNSNLPEDIAVLSAELRDNDFHSRYSAKEKEYRYLIYNSKIKNPFMAGKTLFYDREIDVSLLKKACKRFLGKHDFAAFSASGREYKSTVRTIKSFTIKKKGDIVEITVSADGFLYNMVRILVGTLLEVNEKRINVKDISKIIEKKERSCAGRTVSGEGLYLNRVIY